MCDICSNLGLGPKSRRPRPFAVTAVPRARARVGTGNFTFDADADWAKQPEGHEWPEVAGVAVDSRDRVFVFNRGPSPVMVFERDGTFLYSWGEGQFDRPHGITIGPDDTVYCTDDFGHTVQKFTPEGRLLQCFGTRGRPSETGATSNDFRTIRSAAGPFHYPTNVALSPDGDIYIADGYGNARIHKFAPDGRLLFSWGAPGIGPGEFNIPHGIAINRVGHVFVADRENCRIQVFSATGTFLYEWSEIARPCQITFDNFGNAFVAELGFKSGMWSGTSPPAPDATGGRVSVFDPNGKLLTRWGGGENPTDAGDFFAPHDLCVDSRGAVYVAEVVWAAGGNRGLVSPDCHALQKFSLMTC